MIFIRDRRSKFLSHLILFLNRYGSNIKRLPKIRTLCDLILENFEDKIL